MKTIVAVIIFGKMPTDSLTLNKIYNIEQVNFKLLIVNNGPSIIKMDEPLLQQYVNKGIEVDIENHIDNKPLSIIYNEVISNNEKFDRFIFFDDDSNLDNNFFSDLDMTLQNDTDLQLPVILDKGIIYYPVIDGTPIKEQDISLKNKLQYSNTLFSIGSGLVIYSSLVDKFKSRNMQLFDERFALYGVDYSLFRRLSILRDSNIDINIVVCSKINHSLSRVDAEFSPWRHRERLYDIVLTEKFYSKSAFLSSISLLKLSLFELLKGRVNNVLLIARTFFIGHHPRCK
ncbi:hypothetical protein ACIAIL_29835 [Raoultella ornithinolytica]|uniref:hypothetical protein n=1 Tax=Raoultella ornithinolytica TaxID=54291 RepID=UPI003D6F8163